MDDSDGTDVDVFKSFSLILLSSIFGQFKVVPLLTRVQRNQTSATVGKGSDNMLKGSKFRLECLHVGQVTLFNTCPMAVFVITDRFLRRNLKKIDSKDD